MKEVTIEIPSELVTQTFLLKLKLRKYQKVLEDINQLQCARRMERISDIKYNLRKANENLNDLSYFEYFSLAYYALKELNYWLPIYHESKHYDNPQEEFIRLTKMCFSELHKIKIRLNNDLL